MNVLRGALTARRKPTAPWAPILLLLFLSGASALAVENPAERADRAGALVTLKNHRVLRLFGENPGERGFAQGYLLAEDIRDSLGLAVTSLPYFSAQEYDQKLRPWALAQFVWDREIDAELDGIFSGMEARLGPEGLQCPVLQRAFTRADLSAMNALGDYFGPRCSAFAAAGKRTAGGVVLHARTLDFPLGPQAIARQIVIVSAPRAGKQGWVAVGWPGLVGQYTGMNQSGLVACIHDAYNARRAPAVAGLLPRGLLLRRMLEMIDPAAEDAAEQAARLAGAQPAAGGNLIHLTWPARHSRLSPSAVLEFDGFDRTVKIRRMDNTETLVVTNHAFLRNAPLPCPRSDRIQAGLDLLRSSATPIGLVEARKLLMAAEQPIAAHSVYFYPDSLQLHVALSKGNVISPRIVPTQFTFQELQAAF